jgi:hypothetical protein
VTGTKKKSTELSKVIEGAMQFCRNSVAEWMWGLWEMIREPMALSPSPVAKKALLVRPCQMVEGDMANHFLAQALQDQWKTLAVYASCYRNDRICEIETGRTT